MQDDCGRNVLPEGIERFLTPEQIQQFLSDWNETVRFLVKLEADACNQHALAMLRIQMKVIIRRYRNLTDRTKAVDAGIKLKLNEKRTTEKPTRKPMSARQFHTLRNMLKNGHS